MRSIVFLITYFITSISTSGNDNVPVVLGNSVKDTAIIFRQYKNLFESLNRTEGEEHSMKSLEQALFPWLMIYPNITSLYDETTAIQRGQLATNILL